MDDLVQFLRARLADERERVRSTAGVLARNAGALNLQPERATAHAQEMVTAVEAKIRLFEETVHPYLWVEGRVGRLAELQMRLMAFEYTAHPGYRPEWAPDQA
ncbi:DUF6221 family protein [Streptomyces sp. ISL-94]|uniref:DUF6221 family protein n=1 Tax=Streptomyces sp. ISL-94 TaxID=2819190 RepID=UPI001BE686AD|nr:DUF6221 family protein [Streptomyces sp. ISL-94]MBT2477630.1 hypothetical protein [Streptomyces sp. ISL-94]